MLRLPSIALCACVVACASQAISQTAPPTPAPAPPVRPTPPTRDPHTPGYVTAKELPDGANPPANMDGNFILGPTHNPAREMTAQESVPHGTVSTFTMNSADSKIYPGIAREPNTFGTQDPSTPAKMIVTTSHPAPYTRRVRCTSPSNMSPARRHRSSWEPTVPTQHCSRH